MSAPLFPMGQIVATPGALELVGHEGCLILLGRHQSGDWGELGSFDRRENTRALKTGARLLSSYTVDGQKVWIISEADRSSTCLLRPDEY